MLLLVISMRLQEIHQAVQLLIAVKLFQCVIVRPPVLRVDNDGRMVQQKQQIVHQQPPGPAIAVTTLDKSQMLFSASSRILNSVKSSLEWVKPRLK